MVKAIQEQQLRIETLEKENELLKSDHNQRLEKLEAMLSAEARKEFH